MSVAGKGTPVIALLEDLMTCLGQGRGRGRPGHPAAEFDAPFLRRPRGSILRHDDGTRSKAATAIQKWSRATARIYWPCTPLRSPRNEQSRGLRRRRIVTSASAVELPYSQGDLKCRGRVGEVPYAFL